MPNIFRFLMVCAALSAMVYGALFSLATGLEPAQREIIVIVPHDRHAK